MNRISSLLGRKGENVNDRDILELAAKAAGVDPKRLPHAWPELKLLRGLNELLEGKP